MTGFVAAAYAITVLLLGGYAWSLVARRRGVERELAEWRDEG
jgi:heme exporter protein CcmD